MYKNLKDKTQTNQTKKQTKMTKKPYKQKATKQTSFKFPPAPSPSLLCILVEQ